LAIAIFSLLTSLFAVWNSFQSSRSNNHWADEQLGKLDIIIEDIEGKSDLSSKVENVRGVLKEIKLELKESEG